MAQLCVVYHYHYLYPKHKLCEITNSAKPSGVLKKTKKEKEGKCERKGGPFIISRETDSAVLLVHAVKYA